MTDTATNKPPVWVWALTIFLCLWGLMGIYVFYDFIISTPESMAKYVKKGTYSQGYADALLAAPTWTIVVFATAVFSGAFGALCLVLRTSWASFLYLISLLCIVISHINTFLIAKHQTMMSNGQVIMEMIVLALAVLGLWTALTVKKKGWIRS